MSVGEGKEECALGDDGPSDITRREAERDQPRDPSASLALPGLFSISAKQATDEVG